MCESLRIRDLVQAKLAGRKIDPVVFIDELLVIAKEVGEIRCYLATEQSLRFELDGQACDVALDAARTKLRMVCARLSVLCNTGEDSAVSPYGGEGIIRSSATPTDPWRVRFKNTPGEQEFSIAFVTSQPPALRSAGSKTATP
jgi:hypothetical protein